MTQNTNVQQSGEKKEETSTANTAQSPSTQQQVIIQTGVQESNGLGTAGFVLALLGVFLGWIPVLGWILWVLGLILSFVGVFRKPRGLAIAGLVISLIDIIIWGFVVGSIIASFGLLH